MLLTRCADEADEPDWQQSGGGLPRRGAHGIRHLSEPRRKGLEKKIGGKRRAALQQNEAKCEPVLGVEPLKRGRELGDYGSEPAGQMTQESYAYAGGYPPLQQPMLWR